MKKVTMILILILSLVVAQSAEAQFKMAIGPAVGLNLNLHSGSDLDESGSALGFVIGGQTDMSFTKTIGLLTTIYFYDNRSGSYSQKVTESGVNYLVDVTASIAYFEIEPLFKYTLPDAPFYLVIGPSLGFNVENQGEAKTTITTPGYTFSGGSTTQTNKATIQNMNTRFELKFGGGYVYPLSSSMRLHPQLTFGYGLTNVAKDVNWKILSFGLLASLEFDVIK